MNENHDFRSYLEGLIYGIPSEMYIGAAIVLSIGLSLLIKWKGLRTGLRYLALLAFVEYVTLIYCSTVLFRASRDVHKFDFHPFWSYNDPSLFVENVMNVLVFVPVGLLIGLGFSKWSWWKAIGLGCLISISIETLQFIFKRGFCEMDDVIHNTLGCATGWLIVKSLRLMANGLRLSNLYK